MIFTTVQAIQAAKTSELLAFYNAHRRPIIKFRDRTSAEQRCIDLMHELQAKTPQPTLVQKAPNPVVAAVTNPSPAPTKQPKTYLFAFRDHSGSMGGRVAAAEADYNSMLTSSQKASIDHDVQTVLTVYEVGGGFRRKETLVSVHDVRPLPRGAYKAPGHDTPLFMAIEDAMNLAESLPDANDQETTFLFAATTDGQDNVTGARGGQQLAARIKKLQATDRWTVVFRVPKGDARSLANMGIDPGNILEWELSSRGMEVAAKQHNTAMSDFYANRKLGVKSTRTFYTSVANVTEADVQKLGDISAEVSFWPISNAENEMQIRDFVEKRLNGGAMLKGAAFYQLVKTEDKIQDYKLVAIRNKETGAVHCGPEARDLIGLPRWGDARVRPDTAGKWQVFVQSTSVNRKVTGGTQLLYWPNVGKKFTEGKSAR
jgi:hypothetical protein